MAAARTKLSTWLFLGLIVFVFFSCVVSEQRETERTAERARAERARQAALTPEQRAAARAAKEKAAAEQAQRDAAIARAASGAKLLKQAAFDPDRFELESAIVIDGTGAVCYQYRAANTFGAIMPGQAVLSGQTDRFLTHTDEGFTRLWNAACAGKPGQEVATAIRWFAL